jgi:hypothetical protein
MLLDVTITPLTSLPTAHPSAEAVRPAPPRFAKVPVRKA